MDQLLLDMLFEQILFLLYRVAAIICEIIVELG